MRDERIYRLFDEHAKENGKRFGLLFVQFEYLKTRQEAMEAVERAATPWQRLLFWWNPDAKWAAVDAVQKDLLKKADQEMEQAQQKRKIQLAPASAMPPAAGAIGG